MYALLYEDCIRTSNDQTHEPPMRTTLNTNTEQQTLNTNIERWEEERKNEGRNPHKKTQMYSRLKAQGILEGEEEENESSLLPFMGRKGEAGPPHLH